MPRVDQPIGNVFKGMWKLTKKYPVQILRGSALGTLIGALPGAGADIAAWMSYAMSKKFSKEPEKFGTGHVEGIVESGSANNSALAGAWIPALLLVIAPAVASAVAAADLGVGPEVVTWLPQRSRHQVHPGAPGAGRQDQARSVDDGNLAAGAGTAAGAGPHRPGRSR